MPQRNSHSLLQALRSSAHLNLRPWQGHDTDTTIYLHEATAQYLGFKRSDFKDKPSYITTSFGFVRGTPGELVSKRW